MPGWMQSDGIIFFLGHLCGSVGRYGVWFCYFMGYSVILGLAAVVTEG